MTESKPAMSEEGLTLSDLESHLWEAANILRGSPVDRTDWQSYILPLLFFKRICDVWDEEHARPTKTALPIWKSVARAWRGSRNDSNRSARLLTTTG